MTRDRARKKSVRARMAASAEPYSVAARFEVRKEVTAAPVTAAAQDRHRHGPVKRLADVAVKALWERMLPEQARTAASGTARGIIEPAARQFQHHQVTQDNGVLALAMVISRPELGGTPNAAVITEDPVELLMRLRSVTEARYAGDEIVREARCRKIAASIDGTTAVFTVWVDGEHVRQIQAVTPKPRRRVVTVLATTTVTAQLWDFGVPADSMDWPPLPPPRGRALPLTRRVQIRPSGRPCQGIHSAGQR